MPSFSRAAALIATALALLTFALPPPCLAAASGAPPAAIAPPPMGWSSWNSFSNTVDSAIIQRQADALLASGLHAAGYDHVNIDEGWWLGRRSARGDIVVDPRQWPALAPGEQAGDMANIVRHLHAEGLKAGIYTDAGAEGCSIYPDIGPVYHDVGSFGHYLRDFAQFAGWGFDYVKVDWCGGDKQNLDPAFQYAAIVRAIALAGRATGRTLDLSICNWGRQSPWSWGPGVGGIEHTIWRTGTDIIPPIVAGGGHESRRVTLDGILHNFDDGIHPEAQHTGYINDPDMMVLGMPGTNPAMNRLHMALWAMSGAPLLIGADITKLDRAALDTLRNPDAIAVDQDRLGLQAVPVAQPSPGLQIWSKRLDGAGRRAVLLLNRTPDRAPVRVDAGSLGLRTIARERSVWREAAPVQFDDGTLSAIVPARDGLFLIVDGTDVPPTPLLRAVAAHAPDAIIFQGTSSNNAAFTVLRVTYRNPGPATPVALFSNDNPGTRLVLPTASEPRSVWLQARLAPTGADNRLVFEPIAPGRIDILSVEAF